MSEPQTPAPEVDVAIRARPPSPRRLSRKVLLTGAIMFVAVIALAMMVGLSERPERRTVAGDDSAVAAAGPPETIRLAPSSYELLAPPLAPDQEADPDIVEEEAGALQPTEAAVALGAPRGETRGAGADAVDADHAPILFAGRRDTAGELASVASGRLSTRLLPPRSRYEILAGSVIPAALATELNSDLPGRVIAQVTAPVFDSVSGDHVLIPQGARLIGAYDAAVAHGDARLQIVWHRMILPNGWSIDLANMEGADPAGAAGLRDRVDNHVGRLAGAVFLSSLMSVAANEAEDDDERDGFARSVGDAAAQEAARSGGRIVDRELQINPTLRVRAGAPVRVLVTRDIALRPYLGRRD